MLLSRGDVFKYIKLLRIDLKQSGNSSKEWEIFNIFLINLKSQWPLPVISDQAIIAKIDYWHKSGLILNKIPQNRRDHLFQNKKEAFNELFDISPCDCFDKGIDTSACRCKLKILLIEWQSYVQQKFRIGILSGIEIHETKIIRERALRNETGFRIEEIENELSNEVEIDHEIDTNETIEEPMDEDRTYTCMNSVHLTYYC